MQREWRRWHDVPESEDNVISIQGRVLTQATLSRPGVHPVPEWMIIVATPLTDSDSSLTRHVAISMMGQNVTPIAPS